MEIFDSPKVPWKHAIGGYDAMPNDIPPLRPMIYLIAVAALGGFFGWVLIIGVQSLF